mmetsp:Transcript_10858/g.40521  ORF Transcript_10858/g.40521 Transcript_10858/m.40521 type:complete len:102 (+) Transcript_10858:3673-3978(+)
MEGIHKTSPAGSTDVMLKGNISVQKYVHSNKGKYKGSISIFTFDSKTIHFGVEHKVHLVQSLRREKLPRKLISKGSEVLHTSKKFSFSSSTYFFATQDKST